MATRKRINVNKQMDALLTNLDLQAKEQAMFSASIVEKNGTLGVEYTVRGEQCDIALALYIVICHNPDIYAILDEVVIKYKADRETVDEVKSQLKTTTNR